MADEYIVPLGIDAENILQGFRDVEKGIDRLEQKASESGKAMTSAFSKGAKSAKEMDDAVEKVAPTIEKVNTASKEVTQTMNNVANATEKAVDDKKVNRFRSAWERLKSLITGSTSETKKLNTESDKMNKTLDSINDRMKKIKDILPTLNFSKKEDLERFKALNKELQDLEREYKKLNGLGRDNKKGVDDAGKGIGGLGGIAKKAIPLMAAVFTVDKLIDFGKAIIETTAKFQRLEAMLKTSLGSESSAKRAMIEIQDFASKTPFQVDEVTESYVKLANRGLTPTIQELTKMGDLASSQGKSLDQLTEAVLDAVTGEYERLKEFGIRASKHGDSVSLSFKGITKEVKNSQDAIKDAILEFGEMKGVAGGMAEQSKTVGGAISNMQDAWERLLNTIGQKVAPMITSFINSLSDLINKVSDLIGEQKLGIEISIESAMQMKQEAEWGTKLTDRYEVLKNKGVKATKNEKIEMTKIMYDLKSVFGESILMINKETGAYELNTQAVREAIKQKMILADVELGKAAMDYNKAKTRMNIAQTNQKDIDVAGSGKTDITINGQTFTGIMGRDPATVINDINATKAEKDQAMSMLQNELASDYKKFKSLRDESQKNAEIIEESREIMKAAEDKLKEYGISLDDIDFDKKAEDYAKSLEKLNKAGTGSGSGSGKSGKSKSDLDKEASDQLRKYQRALEDAVIEAMKEGYDKQRAEIEKNFIRSKEDLEAEKSLSKKGAEEKLKLIDQLEKNKIAQIKELQEQENIERLALIAEGQKQMNSLRKEGIDKTLGAIDIEFKEQEKAIKEKYKDLFFLQAYLLKQLQSQRDEKIKNAKYDNEVKKVEDNARLQTAIAEAYGDRLMEIWDKTNLDEEIAAGKSKAKLEQIHKSKALAVIAIEIEKAKKLAELAVQQYGENSIEAQIAQATVAKLKINFEEEIKKQAGTINLDDLFSAINDIGNGDLAGSLGKAFTFKLSPDSKSIAESLGLSEEEQKAIIGSFTAVYNALSDLYSQFIEEQIEKKDEQIALLDDQIANAEDAYNHELELQKQGYHSNVDAKKKELDDLQKMRDKEQAEKEALQKKQATMAQAEIAIQTVVATAQLIAAAAKAFSAHAGIPFVGIALGAAAAAAMVAGFLAMKSTANSATKMEKGGLVGGEPHSKGGTKYRSDNPNAGVVELEKDEYVTNKKSTAKHFDLLEAVNNDNLENFVLNDADFKKMLNGLGVTLMDDKEDTIQRNYELGQKVVQVIYGNNNGLTNDYLSRIEENTKVLADAEANKETTTFENGFKVIRKGNSIRKIKLKPEDV